MREFTARDRSILLAVAAAGAAFVVFYGAILVVRPGDTYLRFHTNVMYNLPALFALALAPVALRRSRGRERAGWACLALALVGWQVADWMYAWYAYVLHADVPFPGTPDILYYAGYAGYVAAIPLLALPARRLRDGRWIIDAAIVIVVAGALGWQFIMRPIVEAGDTSAFSAAVGIGYPLLDLALLSALTVTFFAGGMRLSLHHVALALATLVQVVTDSVYTYTVNTGSYNVLGDPADLGWVAGYALLAITFVVPSQDKAVRTEHQSFVGALAPYAVLVPLAAALIAGGARSDVLIAATLGAFGLVMLRQIVTLRENQTLLHSLEGTSRQLERAIDVERESARRDALTGALNHGAISAELRFIIQSGASEPCGVVMLDVDGMKATNDMFGHQAGDGVLIDVSRAMDCRGAIIGRYGGDEFIALLPGASRADAEAYRDVVAEAIAGIRATDPETGSRIPIEASSGIAMYPEDADDLAGLVGRSDGAMYAEKRRRPVAASPMQPLRDERAARMIGELVPLLTSDAQLNDKARYVVRALAVGAGYDVVALTLLHAPGPTRISYADGSIRIEHAPVRAATAAGRTSVYNDLAAVAADEPALAELCLRGFGSALVAPLRGETAPIGSILVACLRKDVFSAADAAFLMSVATQVAAIVRMSTLVDDLSAAMGSLEHSRRETVMMLAIAAEAHDRSTGMHLRSIRALVEALARELNYSEQAIEEIGLAAVLHDIGKLSVPDAVLARPGALDDDEWDVMKAHTVWGSQFLSGRPGFKLAESVARSHHERWDGTGYPDGLTGEAIPEAATIVTVADSFDAMTHDRPYRSGIETDAAIAEIRACSGSQFNPVVVDALLRLHARGEVARIHGDFAGEETRRAA